MIVLMGDNSINGNKNEIVESLIRDGENNTILFKLFSGEEFLKYNVSSDDVTFALNNQDEAYKKWFKEG